MKIAGAAAQVHPHSNNLLTSLEVLNIALNRSALHVHQAHLLPAVLTKKGSVSFSRSRLWKQSGGSGQEAALQHLVGQGQLQNEEGDCSARVLQLQIRWHLSQRLSVSPHNKIIN